MSGEKHLPATQKKIDDARKKGQVAVSKDLKIVATLFVGYAIVFGMASFYRGEISGLLDVIIGSGMKNKFVWSGDVFAAAAIALALILGPFVLACIVVNMAMTWAQIGFVVAPEAALPSFKKLNAISNIKNMFSKKSLLQLILSVCKVLIVAWVVFLVFKGAMNDMVYSYRGGFDDLYRVMAWVLKKIIFMTLAVFIVIGILDWVIEKSNLLKNLRMSHQDMKDEQKETIGNPEIMSRRKREHFNILNSSLNRVGESKVVVANPTHISVALDYEPGTHDLPYIVAMGVDHDAMRIREKAKELGIPVIVNVELARNLYRDCEEDEYIRREHLELAAQVFRAVLQLDKDEQNES